MNLPPKRTIVIFAVVGLVAFSLGYVTMSEMQSYGKDTECTEHSGVLYLDNDTVRNTTEDGVNITFTVCDQTGAFNGSTGES